MKQKYHKKCNNGPTYIKKDTLREVVSEAIKQATKAHWDEITQKENEEVMMELEGIDLMFSDAL